MDVNALNETISKVLNATLPQMNTTAVDYSDACTPKYFVFNSQVRLLETRKNTRNKLICIKTKILCNISGLNFELVLFFPDCLRCSHPDLRLRVPPCHPAHVRGAQRVSAHCFHFIVFTQTTQTANHSCLLIHVFAFFLNSRVYLTFYLTLLRPNSRSRRKMQGVANVSFLAMFIMYLLAALFGYLTFNGEFL